MKKLLLALFLAAPLTFAYAEGEGVGNVDPATQAVAAASYVKGAYRAVKQEKIGTTITQQMNGSTITGNAPTGSVITGVSVTTSTDGNNNTEATGLTVTRSNIMIPHHSATSTSSYSGIWIE